MANQQQVQSPPVPRGNPADLNRKVNYIPLSYNPHSSHSSATHLVLTLLPEWNPTDLKFIRFTDGITNTLLKCVNSTKEQDDEAVLLRAYGRETGILIDRERECSTHALLSAYNLAPALLARFNNGLLYRYVAGRVCKVHDLAQPDISLAIASRLGEWHGILPVDRPITRPDPSPFLPPGPAETENSLWGVMDKWVDALPTATPEQQKRKAELLEELRFLVESSGLKGLDGGVGLIFGHCDLLNGNVIVLPEGKDEGLEAGATAVQPGETKVHFIDYEYATPCERAFDIANHFAEWGGFDCDYNRMPTRSARRQFIRRYLESYHYHKAASVSSTQHTVTEEDVDALMKEVDAYRGVPGFYWGIWALIQETISQIDFDYAAYAEIRLGEYYAWKKVAAGEVEAAEAGLREARWASEE